MTEKTSDEGGVAFPRTCGQCGSDVEGMTLLDWFAGKALQGLLSGFYRESTKGNLSEVVEEARSIAEAMVVEKRQREGKTSDTVPRSEYDALKEKAEALENGLINIHRWRIHSHDYDRDCGNPLRDFDEYELKLVEEYAKKLLDGYRAGEKKGS